MTLRMRIDLEATPEMLEYSRIKNNEDPDTRVGAIGELREMVYERGECVPHRMDDTFLLRFLRCRSFVPQRAHRLMVKYYEFRKENPGFYKGVYPHSDRGLQAICRAGILSFHLDQATDRRIIYYRLGRWDPAVIPLEELLKASVLCTETGILEPRMQIRGSHVVLDLEYISLQHVVQFTPSVAAKIIQIVEILPGKVYAIHLINNPWIFGKAFAIFKSLLPTTVQDSIIFHGYDVTSLHKHVSPESLPRKEGGDEQICDFGDWIDNLKYNEAVIRELVSCGYRARAGELPPEFSHYQDKE